MTDEQKRIVERLRDTWCYYYRPSSRGYNDDMQASPDTIASLIEYMDNEIDELRAENEQIRQTHVAHEVYQATIDEQELLKQERDAAIEKIREIAQDNCQCWGCAYFEEAGSHELCTLFGVAEADGYCKQWCWGGYLSRQKKECDVCAENGGKDNDT